MSTLLSAQSVGSIVKMNVDGGAKNFIVVHHGLPSSAYDSSCDGTWLLMDDLQAGGSWDSDKINDYANSDVHNYLNNTFINLLDSNIKSAVKSVKIPYTNGTGSEGSVSTGSNGISAKVFLLSYAELSVGTYIYANTEGNALSYFADINNGDPSSYAKRIAKYNGAADRWWTRSPANNGSTNVLYVMDTGNIATTPSLDIPAYYFRPAMILPGTLYVDDDGFVITNTAPVISGSDTSLGTYGTTKPSYQYTVTDAEGDSVTVTEAIDGKTIRTHAATLGDTNTLTFTDLEWMKILNGSHTLTIKATDPKGGTVTRTLTLTKNVTSLSFTLENPLDADDMISRAIEVISAAIPTGASITIEVCNNGYDASPTWEDVTEKVLNGEMFIFTNKTKTADNWGYNVRVNVHRNNATGDCYVVSLIGNFD